MIETKRDLLRANEAIAEQFRLVDDLVTSAFLEIHHEPEPESDEDNYSYREMFPKKGSFSSFQKSRENEGLDRPLPIYRIFLQAAGLDPKSSQKIDPRARVILDKYYHRVSEGRPYTNFDTGQAYFPDDILTDLTSKNRLERFLGSARLGYQIAEQDIRSLAYGIHPNHIATNEEFPLRATPLRTAFISKVEMVAADLERFLQGKNKREFNRRINEFKRSFSMEGMSEEGIEFLEVGGRILCHPIDQPLMRSVDEIGAEFDEGIVKTLSRPVKELFVTLLARQMGLGPQTLTILPEEDELAAEKIYRHMYSSYQHVYPEGGLFSAYKRSEMLAHFENCNAPELSVVYAQLVDPGAWLAWIIE